MIKSEQKNIINYGEQQFNINEQQYVRHEQQQNTKNAVRAGCSLLLFRGNSSKTGNEVFSLDVIDF